MPFMNIAVDNGDYHSLSQNEIVSGIEISQHLSLTEHDGSRMLGEVCWYENTKRRAVLFVGLLGDCL